MSIDPNSPDGQLTRQLIPIKTLPGNRFDTLCEQATIEQQRANEYLFKQGDSENDLIYLIDGRISLQTNEFQIETIASGTDAAKFALAHQIPRKIDALAETDIRFLRLNADMINTLQNTLYQEESPSMMVDDDMEDNNTDWMTTLLKSPIYRALPPANLQRVLIELEEVSYQPDETIIEQGAPGDYYYLIKSGQCLITRKPSRLAKEIKLGQLKSQDTFGEDSLLSDQPRNVSVRALTEVSLLRLKKEHFINLIQKPTLKYIDYEQAQTEIAKGATLLDVREPDAYKHNHLENSINAPFFSLRMHLKNLMTKQPVIVICDDGKTSNAAAFILLRNRIDAYILKGGMQQLEKQTQSSKASFAIDDQDAGVESVINPNGAPTIEADQAETAEIKENQPGTEIERLKQTIAELESKCKTLSDERDELARKYKLLYKQTEKMKNILDSLKSNNDGAASN